MPRVGLKKDLDTLNSILRPIRSQAAGRPSSTHRHRFSVLQRSPPNYPGHVPLTYTERFALALGSATTSLLNPRRADMVAALGETTAQPYSISRLRDRMLTSPTGRRILRDRPRITSKTISLTHLRRLPTNTVGSAYATWLDREAVSPDTRHPVRYIDDEEEAYVMQRYRDCHDFYHALTGLPVFQEGEVALKAFEFANTRLPMTGLAMVAMVRLPSEARSRLWRTYLPWALYNGFKAGSLINVYWEEELETDVEELRARLGIEAPPDLREARRAFREERKRAKQGDLK